MAVLAVVDGVVGAGQGGLQDVCSLDKFELIDNISQCVNGWMYD